MEGRRLIALLLTVIAMLLAVIAGVLLLGQDTMLSGMKGLLQIAVDVSVFGVVIAALWGIVLLARQLIREILKDLSRTPQLREILSASRETNPWEVGVAALVIAGLLLSFVHNVTGGQWRASATSGANERPTFQNEQDALAAAKAGTLTPGPDGTIRVIVNGVPGTLKPKTSN
jgi:hypothetical protein